MSPRETMRVDTLHPMSYSQLENSFCALLAGFWFLLVPSLRAQTLYDATLGTAPESQGWTLGVIAPIVTPTELVTNTSILLDTTGANSTEAGWTRIAPAALNRTNGFALLFTVQINSESHSGSTNRAGFSVIVLGSDTNGIELGFWGNTIFAQADSPLFTHAEDTNFTTTGAFVNYSLTLLATNYFLQAKGATILTGPVRNYTAFNGFPDPYSTPNFLFFGDDTTSAKASFNVRQYSLVLPPSLTMPTPGVLAWTGVSNETYTVQASTNLTDWNNVGMASSTNTSFAFTNSPAQPRQYFRVAFP